MGKTSKIICVTGGKGGTGKTIVAINLAVMFKNAKKKVLLIDGDVENPNTYLLMGGKLENKKEILFFKPKIIEDKCIKCGLCAQHCAHHVFLHLKDQIPIPILTLCSGCKLCYKICPEKAIVPDLDVVGWSYSTSVDGISLLIGELKPTEARSATIVESLMKDLDDIIESKSNNYDIIILDTAPGAHCDVELLISKADVIIPVTEPTKFGKIDLLRIIELIELLKKDYRTIVNRSTLIGYRDDFLKELQEKSVNILGDIPFDEDIVQSYCQGKPLMEKKSGFEKANGYKAFKIIFNKLSKWINSNKEDWKG
ncbi:MAG: AAA family ATPase [Promethearchaeota archaeon]